jgi:hypothetical protein
VTSVGAPVSSLNSHIIMNNNAMFLLDLASASNSNLVPNNVSSSSQQQQQQQRQNSQQHQAMFTSNLSAVSELMPLDPNPFPIVPFQCFQVTL